MHEAKMDLLLQKVAKLGVNVVTPSVSHGEIFRTVSNFAFKCIVEMNSTCHTKFYSKYPC